MSDDDDRTVMLGAMGEMPGGHQFKDVGGDDDDDATVMWSPDQADVATVVVDPNQAANAIAAAEARKAAAAPSGSGLGGAGVLGGIGVIFSYLSMVAALMILMQGMTRETWPLWTGAGLMVPGYALLGMALMKAQGGMAKVAGIFSFIGVVLAVMLLLGLGGVLKGSMWKFLAFTPWYMGIAWVFMGLWNFGVGGGLGITTGITALLGGGCVATFAFMVYPGGTRGDDDMMIALFFGGIGLLLIAMITQSILMFGRLRREG